MPSSQSLLDLNLADSIALTLSTHWQMQCMGLRCVCSMLHWEGQCDIAALNENGGNSMKNDGIASMQQRIDSFNNNQVVDNKAPTASNVVNMNSRGKSSKERRITNNNADSSSSNSTTSSKLTRVSTSAGSIAPSTADGSLATTKSDNNTNNVNKSVSSKGNRSSSSSNVLRKSMSNIQQGSFRAVVQVR